MSASFANLPDVHGRFGPYGGRYVPETLMAALRSSTPSTRKPAPTPTFSASSTTT